MKYLKWDKFSANGIDKDGLLYILTEIDEKGSVTREIGLDFLGNVKYQVPSKSKHLSGKWRGFFDGAIVETGDDLITFEEFNKYWEKGMAVKSRS